MDESAESGRESLVNLLYPHLGISRGDPPGDAEEPTPPARIDIGQGNRGIPVALPATTSPAEQLAKLLLDEVKSERTLRVSDWR